MGLLLMILGCDPSTKRCALADETGRVESILLLPEEGNGRRLALSFEQIKLFARQFAGRDIPDFCVVEQASGKNVHRSLVEMIGVTRAALYAVWEVPVFLMPPSMWKKPIVGNGNASKDDYCEWVRQQGLSFHNDDEAAAICIARAGEALRS